MNDNIKISCKNIWKLYGENPEKFLATNNFNPSADLIKSEKYIPAVRDANIDVMTGEILVIMGLSGSGKSTLLRCMSKLIEPTHGQVFFEGKDLIKATQKELIEIRRHKMGMVFQHFALLPHRTVLQNVAFPLEVQGIDRDKRESRAEEVIKLVGLEGREKYYPRELSGGQQQRVGLARSLAVEPDVWFLDEPFSALDPLIRKEMQNEFLRLQSMLQKTIVFITHDFDEAIRLADRIVIMNEGNIVQVGNAEELITNPANDYVAEFTKDIPRAKLLSVGSIMNKQKVEGAEIKVSQQAKVSEIAKEILMNNAPAAVTDDNSNVVGSITKQDIVNVLFEKRMSINSFFKSGFFFIFAPFLILISLKPFLPKWSLVPPKSCLGGCGTIEGMIPFVQWTNDGIQFLRSYEIFGLFTFREFTRSIADGVDVLLGFTEAILHKGFADAGIGPMPWVMIFGLAIVLGLYLKGWRLALLGGGCFFYLALFSQRGIWELSMKTLSAIAVSTPLAAIIGVALGILAAKRKRVHSFVWPFLNVLQSLPHFSYLILVAIFLGLALKLEL